MRFEVEFLEKFSLNLISFFDFALFFSILLYFLAKVAFL
jgi:hypothetical protein